MANWNLPSLTDLYTNFLTYIKARDDDAARMNDSRVTAATNLPDYAKRWNNTTATIQNWLSSTWTSLILAVAGGGTGASTAAGARTNLDVYSTAEVDDAIASGVTLTTASNALSSNVSLTINGTWYVGPYVSLAEGTWLVIANMSIGFQGTTDGTVVCGIKSSTTTYSTGYLNPSNIAYTVYPMSLSAIVTLGATTTVTGSAYRSGSNSTDYIQGSNLSTIIAVKIA